MPSSTSRSAPLDVDLEKLNVARRQLTGDLGERRHWHCAGGPLEAELGHGLGIEGFDVGREAGIAPLVELDAAGVRAADHVEIPVAGPLLHELLVEPDHRLDVHSRPAPVIEVFGDRVDDRIVAADIHIPALITGVEDPLEDHVFEVLGIGDHGAGQFLGGGVQGGRGVQAALRMTRAIDVEAWPQRLSRRCLTFGAGVVNQSQ